MKNFWAGFALAGALLLVAASFNPGDLPLVYTSGSSYDDSAVITTSRARLTGCHGYMSGSSTQWIMLFDSATVPANGTAAQVLIKVPPTSAFSFEPGERGRFFGSGISWAQSSTSPTKTLGSAETFLSCTYDG